MNRCIYCDVNVKCCTIICRNIAGDETATGGCQSATAMWMFVYQIKHDTCLGAAEARKYKKAKRRKWMKI